ncbi:hypothetical protein MHU86_17794 [Fragilaria crotonensis]|nr:hypothetical protein MHU86_17794 [Fragilaria crotonensis]
MSNRTIPLALAMTFVLLIKWLPVSTSMLNIVEAELWTGSGWTKVAHKIKEPRHEKVATVKRSIGNNGYDETIDGVGIGNVNAMKTNHCSINSDGEHGCVHDHEWQRENQRLDYEIERIG